MAQDTRTPWRLGSMVQDTQSCTPDAFSTMFMRNLMKYHVDCYAIIGRKLQTKCLLSCIADSFHGNGGDPSPLYDAQLTKRQTDSATNPIVLDLHRYADWGFIPSFNMNMNAPEAYSNIINGTEGNTPNILSFAGRWTKYSSVAGAPTPNPKQPFTCTVGEWSCAMHNKYNGANMSTMDAKVCEIDGATQSTQCTQKPTLAKLFNSTLHVWASTSSPADIQNFRWEMEMPTHLDIYFSIPRTAHFVQILEKPDDAKAWDASTKNARGLKQFKVPYSHNGPRNGPILAPIMGLFKDSFPRLVDPIGSSLRLALLKQKKPMRWRPMPLCIQLWKATLTLFGVAAFHMMVC
jgi:hypothetical protein